MKGMLAPKFKEDIIGHAEVRQTIRVPNVGTIAGSYVHGRQDHAQRAASASCVTTWSFSRTRSRSLKRFKDDVQARWRSRL